MSETETLSGLVVRLDVTGRPAPQGSKTAFHHKHTGKIVQKEVSEYVGPWRERVQATAEEWVLRHRHLHPMLGPLVVDMVFSIQRPQDHFGTGRNAGQLKPRARTAYPMGPPDLSKLARSTEDALTLAGLWHDDSRVVRYSLLEKRYTADPDPTTPADGYARSRPGAVIIVRQMEAAW